MLWSHKSLEFIRSCDPNLPDRILEDLKILESKPTIVVTGLIKRGKSTLVNQLLGVEMAPVGINPETITSTIFQSIEPNYLMKKNPLLSNLFSNFIKYDDDEIEFIDSLPTSFKDRIRRKNLQKHAKVFANGEFRFPRDCILIDTPGIDESFELDATNAANISETWRNQGATGAILVTSYPPGISSKDLELREKLIEHFNNRLIIVMKRTQTAVPDNELQEAADVLKRLEISVTTLPESQSSEVPDWESGPLRELEIQMSNLWCSHNDAIREASDRISIHVSNVVDEFLFDRDLSLSDLRALSKITVEDEFHPIIRDRINNKIMKWYDAKFRNSVIANLDELEICIIALDAGSNSAKSKFEFQLSQFYSKSTSRYIGFKEVFIALANHGSSLSLQLIRSISFSDQIAAIRAVSSCLSELGETELDQVICCLEGPIGNLLNEVRTESQLNKYGDFLGRYFPFLWASKYLAIWEKALEPTASLEWKIEWDRQNLDNGKSHRKSIASLFKLASSTNDADLIDSKLKRCMETVSSQIDQFWDLWDGNLDPSTQLNENHMLIYNIEQWRLNLISLCARLSFVQNSINRSYGELNKHIERLNDKRFVFWIADGKKIADKSKTAQKISSRIHASIGTLLILYALIQFSSFDQDMPHAISTFVSGSISVLRTPSNKNNFLRIHGFYSRTIQMTFRRQMWVHIVISFFLISSPFLILQIV